jgi:hypothetical protein
MRMSRTDILVSAIQAGLTDDQAEDIMYDLSPECQTVAPTKVRRAILKAIADERYEEGR